MEFYEIEKAIRYAILERNNSHDNIVINFNNEKNHFLISNNYVDEFPHHILLTLSGEDFQYQTDSEEEFYNAIINDIYSR